MPNPDFTVRVGDTDADIRSTLKYADGSVVDLTGPATVKFRMKPVEGGALTVDANASIVGTPANGLVQYSWQTADTDTAGLFVAEWRVTFPGGQVETFPNDEVLYVLVSEGLSTLESHDYLTLPELKDVLNITGPEYDGQLANAITAASRVVDSFTDRVFYPQPTATARKFTTVSRSWAIVDPFYELVSVADAAGTWILDTEFYAEPQDGPPWDTLRTLTRRFSTLPRSLTVTAKWGYPAVPAEIRAAAKILATRIFRRPREAVFGVAGLGYDSAGIYVSKFDPEVDALLGPYRRYVA